MEESEIGGVWEGKRNERRLERTKLYWNGGEGEGETLNAGKERESGAKHKAEGTL